MQLNIIFFVGKFSVDSLTNKKILDLWKFIAFADDNLNMMKKK